MTTFISPRLRKPLVTALAGVLFASAWLIPRRATLAAFLGLTVTIAIARPAAWWSFVVILGALILGYLFGLSNYGGGDEDPADGAETTRATPSRVG